MTINKNEFGGLGGCCAQNRQDRRGQISILAGEGGEN
jgi:hypothetical protein